MSKLHSILYINKGQIFHNKYGGIEDLACHFICLSPIGDYKVPSKENLDDQIKYIKEWQTKIDFPISKHALKYETLAESGGALSVYLVPNIPAKSDKLRAFGKYMAWGFLMDDILDEIKFQVPLTTTYEAISKDINALTSILDGEVNGKTNAPEPMSTLSHFTVLCAILQDIHESMSNSCRAFEKKENRKYFVKSVNDFLHSILWNIDRNDWDHTSEFVFINYHVHYSGYYTIFELVALLNDIDWAETGFDREDLEFQNWRTSFATAFAITNDVMSLRKEIGEEERENLAIHRHLNSGLSINAALKQTVHVANTELYDVEVYGERLLAHNQGSKDMKRVLQFTYWFMDGHLWWYKTAKRHGQMELQEYYMTGEERYNHVHGHKKKHNHGWVENEA